MQFKLMVGNKKFHSMYTVSMENVIPTLLFSNGGFIITENKNIPPMIITMDKKKIIVKSEFSKAVINEYGDVDTKKTNNNIYFNTLCNRLKIEVILFWNNENKLKGTKEKDTVKTPSMFPHWAITTMEDLEERKQA